MGYKGNICCNAWKKLKLCLAVITITVTVNTVTTATVTTITNITVTTATVTTVAADFLKAKYFAQSKRSDGKFGAETCKKNYEKRGYTESLKSFKKEKKKKIRISGKKYQEIGTYWNIFD